MADGIIYPFLFGFMPVFFWLWFWTRKDCHPEPKIMILKTFFLGASAVPFALAGEWLLYKTFFTGANVSPFSGTAIALNSFFALLVFALIEEIAKYKAARYGGLNSRYFDEPIDALIYMITAALGFAALENAIFVFKNINSQELLLISGMRFLGATLLHTLASAIVGISIAYQFPAGKFLRQRLVLGLILAAILHAFFNFYILKRGSFVLVVFSIVWLLILFLILYLKQMRHRKI